jgi:hypothetical protein
MKRQTHDVHQAEQAAQVGEEETPTLRIIRPAGA